MGSRLVSPPGHPAQAVALITAKFADVTIAVHPTDNDLKTPLFTTDSGEKITSTPDIGRFIAGKAATADALYPPSAKADIDNWLNAASSLESSSSTWIEPSCKSATNEERDTAKTAIEQQLASIDSHLASSTTTALVGSAVTVADIAVACSLVGLYQFVLGKDIQVKYVHVTKWLQTCMSDANFISVLGTVTFCSQVSGWVAPQVEDDGNKKKKSGENGNASSQEQQSTDGKELDPEKLAKKLAKQAEKEAKKAKALAKKEAQAKAAAETEAAGPAGQSKKAKAKAEAEAKRAAEAVEMQEWLEAARATPQGIKKDVSGPMPKGYSPAAVETAWYEWWEEAGYFKAEANSDKPPFVIVIPPPNVTGTLHIGHALTDAVQDTIVRWRRMSGYNTLWVPGKDHAGIATQTVVEKKLAREQGITRHDLGREDFLKEVFAWVADYGDRIDHQIRRMGASVDWSRMAFTMDDARCASVQEAFIRLHEAGLIYRDNRLVNWCCRLKTAVSDIEVDYIDIPHRTSISVPGYDELVEFGVLTSFAYPLEDGDGEIVVATTRPETMLGDTAVAVHPDDDRYKHLQGKFAIHPVNNRRIPIICDAELVDPTFGTGAVKITPAHDPNDFMTGKRHKLEFINILDDNGCINSNETEQFAGQPRFQARITVVDYLKEKGLFRGLEDNPMRLGICSRSKDVIEPVLKPQWWVDCQDMAAKACDVVRDGRLEIIPRDFEATWFRWMENIRDWCISRQLWWGHRIPAYYVSFKDGGNEEDGGDSGAPGAPSERMDRWVIGRTLEEATANAAKQYPGRSFAIVQDEDVLDTWFSSGLFPFSVFNWPEQSLDLEKFYPGALLETGHDILFFWVARMVMMGMQLTGKVPFKQVYLHAMVRDAHGRKMSKSLGNVIDPIDVVEGITLDSLHDKLKAGNLDAKEFERAKAGQKADFPEGIEECGTDALRFALVSYTSQGRDINLDIKRVVGYRHWCNKLWNAIRFAMMNLGDDYTPPAGSSDGTLDISQFTFPARWILSRLSNTTDTIVVAMEKYDFSTASQAVYGFWQSDLCDIFIELMKPVMRQTADEAAKDATRAALWICLDRGLRLLHPIMPFVTEELWQRLPGQSSGKSIMMSDYPAKVPSWEDATAEANMAYLMNVVTRVRALRNDYSLVKEKPPMYLSCKNKEMATLLSSCSLELVTLTSNDTSEVLDEGASVPKGCGVAVVDDLTTVYLNLSGILDATKELEKLGKKEGAVVEKLTALQRTMGLPGYHEGTPEAIKVSDEDKVSKLEAELATVRHHIEEMKQLLE